MPDNAAVCGVPVALSATLRFADLVPVALGVNVTVMLQVPLAAKVAGEIGQLLVWAKSTAFVPVTPIELMVRAVVPVFVSTTVCGALLVFNGWLPNPTDAGEREAPALPEPV